MRYGAGSSLGGVTMHAAGPGAITADGCAVEVAAFDAVLLMSHLVNTPDDQPRLRATAHDECDGQIWTHTFTAKRLTDQDVAEQLAAVGLELVRRLDPQRAWFAARRSGTA